MPHFEHPRPTRPVRPRPRAGSRVRPLASASASAAALALGATAATADLLLNEVLYDPAGADEGSEFVELWNPDSVARPLADVVLEVGDGARPGAWTEAFVGRAEASVGAGAAYLIDASALTAPLQNGPDAIRLRRGPAVLDLLGYGDLVDAALYEGAPAADVPSGASLARLEDGVDRDRNDADWIADPDPTPGRPNRPGRAVRISIEGVAPEVAWPEEPVAVRATVTNRGKLPLADGGWGLRVERFAGSSENSSGPPLDGLDLPGAGLGPGASTVVAFAQAAPPRGPYTLRIRSYGGSPLATFESDTAAVPLRSGAAPAVINEISFRDRGFGEWIELFTLELIADLGAFFVCDRDGRPVSIDTDGRARPVGAGEYVVIAEDPPRLRLAYALPESIAFGVLGAWPTLNDLDRADGIADAARLIGPGGFPSDAAAYRGAASTRGGSLERLSWSLPSGSPGTWVESVASERATPGRPNSLVAPSGPARGRDALIVASATALRHGVGGILAPVVLRLTERAHGLAIRVRIHDLLGRTVRVLLDGQRVFGEAALPWDGRDDAGRAVAPGFYVVAAEGRAADGDPPRRSSLVVAVPAGVEP